MTSHELILILFLLFLLFFSAFFSGSETSIFSLNRYRLEYLAKKGEKKAKIIQKILKEPDILIATILLGNNFVNVLASSIATLLAITLFGSKGVIFSTLLLTFVLLVFCEIAPKTLSIKNPEKISFFVAKPISIIFYFLKPIVKILTFFSNLFLKMIKIEHSKLTPSIIEGEIREIISLGEKSGAVAKKKKEMLHNLLEIGHSKIKEIMVPRTEVVFVSEETTLSELIKILKEKPYTRFPVYKGRLDNIIGIIHAKDILSYWDKKDKFSINDILREPFFVPESARTEDVLYQFLGKKTQLAIVVDEYGEVEGIITLEDILEEIVGEIQDEFDKEENLILPISETTLMAEGNAPIKVVNSKYNTNLPEDREVSIAGFILSLFGRIPKEGEEIKFENRLLFKVFRMDDKKISKVLIKFLKKSDKN